MVTDMSGSMNGLADDVRGGFNGYLDELAGQGAPAEPNGPSDVDYLVSVVLFDHEYMPLCIGVPAAQATRLTEANYRPRGNTALLDAVGRAIADFELRVGPLGEADKVILVVQTDGLENCSREYSSNAVKALLDERTGQGGKWSVMYIGAGMDSWAQAEAMGVRRGGYVNTSRSRGATRAVYAAMGQATVDFAELGDPDRSAQIVREATKDK